MGKDFGKNGRDHITWGSTQDRLWTRYKSESSSIAEYLADIHACISCAHALQPVKGARRGGSSHLVTYFEHIADASAYALCLLRSHGHSIEDFESDTWDNDEIALVSHTLDLHRMVTNAYMQVRDSRPDELFWFQMAMFVRFCSFLAGRHRRNLLAIIRRSHLQ